MEIRNLKINKNENLEQLELPHLLEKLIQLLVSPYAKPHVENLSTIINKIELEEKLTEVSELLSLLDSGYAIPIGEVSDIQALLASLKPADSYLEAEHILLVQGNLISFQDTVRFF